MTVEVGGTAHIAEPILAWLEPMSVEAGIKRYRLVERIAQGAFGAVWRAADRVPGKELAIRVVPGPMASQEALAAFEAEMTRATSLRHRALAQVYEVGRTSDGAVWAASEFVVGDSLEDVLAERGPLSPRTALGLFSELAHAVAELHGHGLAHGSISARTVLLPRSKSAAMRPKLIGLGRALLLPRERRTASPPEGHYSSPEMVASQQYSAASDIWALGVLLFHCVMGTPPPFTARTTTSSAVGTRALRRILDGIDDEIVRGLVEQCLALAPADRPTTSALIKQADLAGWIEENDADVAPADVSTALPAIVAPIQSPLAAAPPAPEQPRAMVQSVAVEPESSSGVEPVVDFRPRRPGAKAVALIVASAIALALLVATSRPTRRSAARVVPEQVAASVSAAVPSAAASLATTATATVAPVVSASVPPPTPTAVESAVKPVAANATPPPRKADQDDNPYE